MPQRTEPRVHKDAPVRIFGLDSKGRPINQTANTIDISRRGARLSGVKCWDYPGETVGIRFGSEKARYKVVWVGLPGSAVDGQVGLQCVEAGKYIWDVAPPSVETHVSETSGFSARSSGQQIGLAPMAPKYSDRRRKDQRFNVAGGANIREVGKNIPQWTQLADLSMGGCYVETTAPFPVHTRVDVTLHVGDLRIDTRGVVTVAHPLVGMGVKFSEMSPLNRDRMNHLMSNLEHSEAHGAGGHF